MTQHATTTRSLTFGRGPEADIQIDDPYVSPLHCRVTQTGGRFWIEDLGSTNGTWVTTLIGGTQRIRGLTLLGDTDIVRIGRTVLPWTA